MELILCENRRFFLLKFDGMEVLFEFDGSCSECLCQLYELFGETKKCTKFNVWIVQLQISFEFNVKVNQTARNRKNVIIT